MAAARCRQPADICQRQWRDQNDFKKEPLCRADRQRLLEIAVDAECQRQSQRHPGKTTALDGHQADTEDGERDGEHLSTAQPFAQKERAKRDVDQRVDEIAESRLERPARTDRPDVDRPVHRDETGREKAHGKHARLTEHREETGKATQRQENRRRDRHRPQHAVGHHFVWRDVGDGLHVERQEPPKKVGREGEGEAAITAEASRRGGLGGCHGHDSGQWPAEPNGATRNAEAAAGCPTAASFSRNTNVIYQLWARTASSSRATMLVILMAGLTAGPAVSL